MEKFYQNEREKPPSYSEVISSTADSFPEVPQEASNDVTDTNHDEKAPHYFTGTNQNVNLQNEFDEVRKIYGDAYVSLFPNIDILKTYHREAKSNYDFNHMHKTLESKGYSKRQIENILLAVEEYWSRFISKEIFISNNAFKYTSVRPFLIKHIKEMKLKPQKLLQRRRRRDGLISAGIRLAMEFSNASTHYHNVTSFVTDEIKRANAQPNLYLDLKMDSYGSYSGAVTISNITALSEPITFHYTPFVFTNVPTDADRRQAIKVMMADLTGLMNDLVVEKYWKFVKIKASSIVTLRNPDGTQILWESDTNRYLNILENNNTWSFLYNS